MAAEAGAKVEELLDILCEHGWEPGGPLVTMALIEAAANSASHAGVTPEVFAGVAFRVMEMYSSR